MTSFKIIFFLVFINLGFFTGKAQTGLSGTPDIPIDSSIKYGRLDNGFTYFIKSIPSESRTIMRLVHKAGSNQDDPDQLNPAHAIEHLAYASSRNFPKGIRNSEQMEALDMTIYDFTAYSGPRSTQYDFEVPPGDSTALNVGLLWFKDIVNGLHLTDVDINNERGILLQEYLSKVEDNLIDESTNSRLKDLIFPCASDFSGYIEYLDSFEPEVLRRFYNDWYRPELFAISVVGNISDLDSMERKLKKFFGDIPMPEHPREPRSCDKEYYKRAPQFYTVKRPKDSTKLLQKNNVKIKLIYRDPITAENLDHLEGIKRLMIMEMLTKAVDNRLSEATEQYKSPYMSGFYPYRLWGLPPLMEVKIQLQEVGVQAGVQKAVQVINQLGAYGVTKEEWEELRQKQLQNLDSRKVNAKYWLLELKRYFAYDEALSENKKFQLRTWLSQVTFTDFNNAVHKFLSKMPEDIGVIAPAGHIALSYTEKDFRSWIADMYEKKTVPYRSPEIIKALLTTQEVQALRQNNYIEKNPGPAGLMEYTLANGLKVVLNNDSSSRKGKIHLLGFSLNGAKSFSEKDYFSALNAPSIIRNAGVNGWDKFKLQRFLAKTSFPQGPNFYVSDFESGVKAQVQVKDLEQMLQLIYLYFTRPNKSRIAYEDWKIKAKNAYLNPSYSLISADFNVARREILGESGENGFFDIKTLAGTKTFEGIKKTKFSRAYKIFQRLFGNPEDFTFIVNGNFDGDTVLPLIEKYLGNLPNRSYAFPAENKEETVTIPTAPILVNLPAPKYYRMKNKMYGINFIEEAKVPNNWKEEIVVEALAGVATKKAWALRFEKGYSLYDIGVWGIYNHQMNRYEIGTVFPCVPEEYPLIPKEFKRILSEIKKGAVSDNEFKDGLKRMYMFHSAKRMPLLMYKKIYEYYRYGETWVSPIEEEKFARSVTKEDVVEAANKYLREENRYEFLMKTKDLRKF